MVTPGPSTNSDFAKGLVSDKMVILKFSESGILGSKRGTTVISIGEARRFRISAVSYLARRCWPTDGGHS